MDIKVIATGSKGNCIRVSDGVTTVLLECGISIKAIKKALDYRLSDISAVFITHEHRDHSQAVKDVFKSGIDVYMTEGTAEELNLKSHRLRLISEGQRYAVGTIEMVPITAYHDAKEPVCFYLYSKVTGERLFFATDTKIAPCVNKIFDYIIVEINHSYNEIIKCENKALVKRVLNSHLSLESFEKWFSKVDKSKLKELHIVHMSDTNADESLIKTTLTDMIETSTKLVIY